MSCAVVLRIENEGKPEVWLGADAYATKESGSLHVDSEPKIIDIPGGAMVCLGRRTDSQALQTGVLPKPLGEGANQNWVVAVWIPAAKRLLREHGLLKVENGVESVEIDLILVFGDWFCVIDGEDFQVMRPSCGYGAIGSGSAFALGAIHAGSYHCSAQDRLRGALCAAAEFNARVGPPFEIRRVWPR